MTHVRRTGSNLANWFFAEPPPDLSVVTDPPLGAIINGMEPVALAGAGDFTFQAEYPGPVVIGQTAQTSQAVTAIIFTDGSVMRPRQKLLVEPDD